MSYIRVDKIDFDLIKTGEYIRWEKVDDEKLVRGSVILRVGSYEGRKNWLLGTKTGNFTLYWDNVEYVMVRINIFYERLKKKTDQISAALLFISEKLNISKELNEFLEKTKNV